MSEFTQEHVEKLFDMEDCMNVCTNIVHFTKSFFIDNKYEAEECFEILKIAYEKVLELNEINKYLDSIPEPKIEYLDRPDCIVISGFIPLTVEMNGELKQIAKIAKIAMNHYDSY